MAEQETALRELNNAVEVVGKVKTLDLEEREFKKGEKKGQKFMGGRITIQSIFDDKVEELPIEVFITKLTKKGAESKLFKSIKTVKDEYKSIDEHGAENADRIKVDGELTLNQYYGQDGSLKQFNQVRGVFFNRLDSNSQLEDKAIASVEAVIEGLEDDTDRDGVPNGDQVMKAFTVGYGNRVHELKRAIIKENLVDAVNDLYEPGMTARLTLKINNYVEVQEEEAAESPSHGFGTTEKPEASVAKNYVGNLEVTGGDQPFIDEKAYSEEEIAASKRVRELAKQELQQPAGDTPQNTGFGEGAKNESKTETKTETNKEVDSSSDDDVPDF